VTRGLSLVVAAFHLLIIGLALLNEDPLPVQGWPVVGALVLGLLATAVAWRAPWRGGRLVLAGGGLAGLAALGGGLGTGLGVWSLLPALGYAVPSLVLGALFCAQAPGSAGVGAEART
jgi:hypothetical protein